VPRTSSTLCGKLLSSIVSATLGFLASALSFGAFEGLASTNSRPFQWNQMGTTLGVPSRHRLGGRELSIVGAVWMRDAAIIQGFPASLA
jgi:hypothetical protein